MNAASQPLFRYLSAQALFKFRILFSACPSFRQHLRFLIVTSDDLGENLISQMK